MPITDIEEIKLMIKSACLIWDTIEENPDTDTITMEDAFKFAIEMEKVRVMGEIRDQLENINNAIRAKGDGSY